MGVVNFLTYQCDNLVLNAISNTWNVSSTHFSAYSRHAPVSLLVSEIVPHTVTLSVPASDMSRCQSITVVVSGHIFR